MTDTEGLEAMKARHREELAEWRTRYERAEADNAALVLAANNVQAAWDAVGLEEALSELMDLAGKSHPGDAMLEHLRQAEQERGELRAGLAEALRERDAARREAAMAVEAAHDSDARAHVAEQERDDLRARLATAREQGRLEGLEQAAELFAARAAMYGNGSAKWQAETDAKTIRTLSTQPAQEATIRQDRKVAHEPPATLQDSGTVEPPDTAAIFATVREAFSCLSPGPVWQSGCSALSALERRMGAMERERTVGLACLGDAANTMFRDMFQAAEYMKRVVDERNALLTSTPPVGTLEALMKVVRKMSSREYRRMFRNANWDVMTMPNAGRDGLREILRRLGERAGRKP